MKSSDVIWRLANLASLPYQERFVLGGSIDYYVLETDLLEDVYGLKFLLEKPKNRAVLTEQQIGALTDIIKYIEASSHAALAGAPSPREMECLIRESLVWKTLRAKATDVLRLFDVDIDAMSVEEVEHLSDG